MDAQDRLMNWLRENPGATLGDAKRAKPGGFPGPTVERVFRGLVGERKIIRAPEGGWRVSG